MASLTPTPKYQRLRTTLYLAWAANALVVCLAPHSLGRLADASREWILQHGIVAVEVSGTASAMLPSLWVSAALLAGTMAQVSFWPRVSGGWPRRVAVLALLAALLSLVHLPWVAMGTPFMVGEATAVPGPSALLLGIWSAKLVGLSLVASLVAAPVAKRFDNENV